MSVQILTVNQKETIYNLFMQGASKASIARMYGVSERTIRRVISETDGMDVGFDDDADMEADTESFESDEEFDFSEDFDDDEADIEVNIAPAFYSFFMDPEHIYLARNGEEEFNLYRGDAQFDFVLEILSGGAFSQDVLQEAHGYLIAETDEMASYMEAFGITLDDDGFLVYNTESGHKITLPVGLTSRINLALTNKDYDELDRLGMFTEMMFQNPSNRVVRELFDFTRATNIELDDEGFVIAWKRVREDYKDCYSGTFDNSPGSVVSVDRNMVNENSEEICSYGLHVCSKSYLNSYSGARVVKVRVHPADFVSIPNDYYDGDRAKARVCSYEVLYDATEEWRNEG